MGVPSSGRTKIGKSVLYKMGFSPFQNNLDLSYMTDGYRFLLRLPLAWHDIGIWFCICLSAICLCILQFVCASIHLPSLFATTLTSTVLFESLTPKPFEMI